MQEYKLYLNLINEMINRIESSTKNISQEKFLLDVGLQDSTLMRLQVIGENLKSMPSEIKKKNKQVKWRKYTKLRNVISHKYNSVDYNIIWDFIKNNLKELKSHLGEIK